MGLDSYVSTIAWQKVYVGDSRSPIAPQHDSLLVYARSERSWAASRNLMPRSEENLEAFGNPDNDPRGSWRSTDMSAQGGHATAAQFYDLELPGGRVLRPPPVSYTHLTLPT